MRIRFVCPTVEIRAGRWAPAIEAIREGATDSFPCVWRYSRVSAHPSTWIAFGAADVDENGDAGQLAAIQADARITLESRQPGRELDDDADFATRLPVEERAYRRLRESRASRER